jgi:hypothetical protein
MTEPEIPAQVVPELTKADVMEAATGAARELIAEMGLHDLKPGAQAFADAKSITDQLNPVVMIAKMAILQEGLDKALKDIGGYTAQVADLEQKLRQMVIFQAIINERVRAIYETMELTGTATVGGRIRNLSSDEVHKMVDKKIEFLKSEAARGNFIDTKAGGP